MEPTAAVKTPSVRPEVEPNADQRTAVIQRCPVCREKVLVKLPGEIVIRNAILRIDSSGDRVSAKCRRCKAWVEVPLRFVG